MATSCCHAPRLRRQVEQSNPERVLTPCGPLPCPALPLLQLLYLNLAPLHCLTIPGSSSSRISRLSSLVSAPRPPLRCHSSPLLQLFRRCLRSDTDAVTQVNEM
ncbi:hypothetical protein M758_4G189500 [Ceratodon purpureus]|nr:hypothetical protein M758_4G189500 [Ceratodon purpureus]